jgi:membrane protease subunit (stomatin/prohibitin family)
LRLGSQLVVYPSQTALFVKGGVIADEFQSGTYTIKSENIPILGKLINIPFNSESPFKAEVWFVNQVAILDCKWGTATNINIEDPKYKIIVPVRAFGQYGFTISNPRVFLESFVGNMASFSTERLKEYFKGIIVSKLTGIISTKLLQDDVSVVNISSYIDELSLYSEQTLNEFFLKYGVTLRNFTIMSISVKEDDESFKRLKEAKDLAAKISVVGTQNYRMERSFDVLDRAASNGGGIMGSSLELGAGITVGTQVGHMTAEHFNTNPQSVPPIPIISYYLAINGSQQGPYNTEQIKQMITMHSVSAETLAWKEGMSNWEPLSSLSEFTTFFRQTPPPIPTF